MNRYVKVMGWLMSVPVLVSLAGCPAMAAMRVAKKVSESSSSSDKEASAKSGTAVAPATTTTNPAGTP